MSEFARRKVTSALSYLRGKPAPMVTLAPEPPDPVPSTPRDTFFVEACSCWKSCFFLAGLWRGSMSSSTGNAVAAALLAVSTVWVASWTFP